MKKLWNVAIYETKTGFKVVLSNYRGETTQAKSNSIYNAFRQAEAKLVVKPPLEIMS